MRLGNPRLEPDPRSRPVDVSTPLLGIARSNEVRRCRPRFERRRHEGRHREHGHREGRRTAALEPDDETDHHGLLGPGRSEPDDVQGPVHRTSTLGGDLTRSGGGRARAVAGMHVLRHDEGGIGVTDLDIRVSSRIRHTRTQALGALRDLRRQREVRVRFKELVDESLQSDSEERPFLVVPLRTSRTEHHLGMATR